MNQAKLYVGNLPFSVGDNELRELFSSYGTVENARVITDRDSGRSKGFGFVEFSSSEDAQKATELDGNEVDGRRIKVNVAREERRDGGGGGGGRGGFGGGGGGGRRW